MHNDDEGLRIKKGYLKEDFLFFHLKDKRSIDFEFHYHDFDKIIIFISGDVTYLIEGKSYKLKPWDILFVSSNHVHKPIINPNEIYERIVIWINPLFIEKSNTRDCDLLNCFHIASEEKLNLLRLDQENIKPLKQNLFKLSESIEDADFGSSILKNAMFLQLLVNINRLYLGTTIDKNSADIKYDERIEKLLDYINNNLDKDLSVDNLAQRFYLTKYYLMHLFKCETGYTVHGYIQKKRLIKAASLLKSGLQASEVCSLCGFGEYSSFVRAFKKEFSLSPRQYNRTIYTK